MKELGMALTGMTTLTAQVGDHEISLVLSKELLGSNPARRSSLRHEFALWLAGHVAWLANPPEDKVGVPAWFDDECTQCGARLLSTGKCPNGHN